MTAVQLTDEQLEWLQVTLLEAADEISLAQRMGQEAFDNLYDTIYHARLGGAAPLFGRTNP